MTITDEDDYAGALPVLPQPTQHDPMKDIANIVKVSVRQWDEESEGDLWSLPDTLTLDPGQSRTFLVSSTGTAQGRDERTGLFVGARDQAVREWLEPTAPPDVTANAQSDGNGNDLTASVGITFTAAGTSARLTLENEHATDTIHITSARVRAAC